ncbi:MAG: thiamine pyrophosphate-dependent enzyme [Candidatus Thorarchaeota archaeon]|nr:thiamine pyrophosphate-dependent enzyme [Candidatus Thorarchaeota archaeon]
MITEEMLEGAQKITWCTGCGNFGILAALKKTLTGLDVPHHNLAMVSGIGCNSKIPHYINLNAFHTLHGRAIPIAQGVHLANTDLTTIVHVGDGDTLGEGLGHLLHAARRNVNIAVFLHNNGVNGLTKGQFSPAAPRGYVSKTSPPPPGAPMDPVNTVGLAITGGATFVARGFSGDQKMLVEIMTRAIKHKGFAVVDILQPCMTWNRTLNWAFYNERTYSLQETDHDISNRWNAIERAFEYGDKIPIGVFYEKEEPDLAGGLALPEKGPLKDHETDLKKLQELIDSMTL